MLRTLRT